MSSINKKIVIIIVILLSLIMATHIVINSGPHIQPINDNETDYLNGVHYIEITGVSGDTNEIEELELLVTKNIGSVDVDLKTTKLYITDDKIKEDISISKLELENKQDAEDFILEQNSFAYITINLDEDIKSNYTLSENESIIIETQIKNGDKLGREYVAPETIEPFSEYNLESKY